MTVTILDARGAVPCAAGPLEVEWTGPDGVSVVLECRSTPGRGATHVQRLGDRSLLLTGLPEDVALVARPVTPGTVFADRVVVGVQLSSHDSGDQIVVPPVDVSGTTAAVLLTVGSRDGRWLVTAEEGAATRSSTLPVGEVSPESLVKRAAYGTRRRIGASSLPPLQQRSMVAVVDRSASMLAHQRSGAVQSLLEVVLGVNLVCGMHREVPVWTLELPPRQLSRALDVTDVGRYVTERLDPEPYTSGCTLAPLIRDLDPADPAVAVVITDDVPADLPEVAAALAANVRPVAWHLLAIARGPGDPAVRLEPWRDELSALAPMVGSRLLTVSSVTPGSEPGWLARELAAPDRLDGLVAGLGLFRDMPATGVYA